MPSLSHMSASSLASAMLTARKVFSWILAVSATRVEEHGNDRVDDLAVQELGAPAALVGHARDQLRRVLDRVPVVARVDALRRVAEEEVAPDASARRLEDREDDLLGRSRIRRRLKDDELAVSEVRCHGLGGRDDVGQVGRPRLRERRRDADRQRIELGHRAVIRGRLDPPVDLAVALDRNVDEVGAALLEGAHLRIVQIDAGDLEPGLRERHRERQPRVAEADDPDLRLARSQAFVEGLLGCHKLCHKRSIATNEGRRSPLL